MRAAMSTDGEEHYIYVLMYGDGILTICLYTKVIIKDIQRMVRFNNYKIKVPDSYLGA